MDTMSRLSLKVLVAVGLLMLPGKAVRAGDDEDKKCTNSSIPKCTKDDGCVGGIGWEMDSNCNVYCIGPYDEDCKCWPVIDEANCKAKEV